MEEQGKNFNSEELKREANNTFEDIKTSFKDVNIKEESKSTKNFIVGMIDNPIEKAKEVANDNNKQYTKTALFVLILWTIGALVYSIIYTFKYRVGILSSYSVFGNMLYITKMTIAPAVSILIISLVILMFKRKNSNNLTTIITSMVIAYIPVVIGTFLRLIQLTTYRTIALIETINSILYIITIILSYFAIEDICEQDDLKFIKKFIAIKGIYLVVVYVFSFLGMVLYN